MSDLKLAYGCVRALPEGITAAWGARWIWPDDLVYNRQDVKGADGDLDRLLDWLNNGGALARARKKARELAGGYGLSGSENRTVTLFEDERGIIRANPQGSYGYLYVAAWLK